MTVKIFDCVIKHQHKQTKIVSDNDQEIPQSQTTDNPIAPRKEEPLNHHETPGRQIKQSNQLSLFPIKMIAILEWT